MSWARPVLARCKTTSTSTKLCPIDYRAVTPRRLFGVERVSYRICRQPYCTMLFGDEYDSGLPIGTARGGPRLIVRAPRPRRLNRPDVDDACHVRSEWLPSAS